jgi:hypothetical protein
MVFFEIFCKGSVFNWLRQRRFALPSVSATILFNLIYYLYISKSNAMEKNNMTTLSSVLTQLESRGYTTQFKAVEAGLLSLQSHHTFKPDELRVAHFYRFEGESNQDDSAILYAIETKTNEKGTLVDGYGPSADTLVGDFMQQVEGMHK